MGLFDFLNKDKEVSTNQDTEIKIESQTPLIEIRCPYCKQILDSMPQRKKKCIHCGNYIHSLKPIIGENKVLMMEVEARDTVFVKEKLTGLEYYNITKEDYENKFNLLSKKSSNGVKPTDVLWGLYRDLNEHAIKSGDFGLMRNMQYSMAQLLYHEGKDFFDARREAEKLRLIEFKKIGVSKVKIASPDSCTECAKNNGRVLTISEALTTMPIPNPMCKTKLRDGKEGWCRCRYVAEL